MLTYDWNTGKYVDEDGNEVSNEAAMGQIKGMCESNNENEKEGEDGEGDGDDKKKKKQSNGNSTTDEKKKNYNSEREVLSDLNNKVLNLGGIQYQVGEYVIAGNFQELVSAVSSKTGFAAAELKGFKWHERSF